MTAGTYLHKLSLIKVTTKTHCLCMVLCNDADNLREDS